jgi:hypothetical protein
MSRKAGIGHAHTQDARISMSRDLPPWRSDFFVLWACIHNMIAARARLRRPLSAPVTRAELVRVADLTRERPLEPQILFASTE